MVQCMKRLILFSISMIVLSGCSLVKQKTPTATPTPSTTQTVQPTPAPTPEVSTIPDTNIATQGGTVEKTAPKQATIKTPKGEIVVELYPTDAPNTVQNFLTKIKSGYYTNLTFHRVESWVIQGGDPVGNGTGGGKMPTELSDRKFEIGSLGVARGGDINVSNDSQFFICTDDCSWLTGQYTNFGKVTKGMDVAKKMAVGDKILGITAN